MRGFGGVCNKRHKKQHPRKSTPNNFIYAVVLGVLGVWGVVVSIASLRGLLRYMLLHVCNPTPQHIDTQRQIQRRKRINMDTNDTHRHMKQTLKEP